MKAIDEKELIMKKDESIEKYQLEGYDPEEEAKQESSRSRKSLTKQKGLEERAMRNPSPPTSSKSEVFMDTVSNVDTSLVSVFWTYGKRGFENETCSTPTFDGEGPGGSVLTSNKAEVPKALSG